MKYQSSNTKAIFELNFQGKKRYTCPECNNSRSKKEAKDLQYYPDNNRAYCFHCDTTLFEYKPFEKKEFTVPEWKNKTELTDKAVKWCESRMIKQETLVKMRIYSDQEWMPQFQKVTEVICFPFFVNERLINIKYRGPKKSFKLVSGSQILWYNYNAILEHEEIIIVEGEFDCLAFVQCGFYNCISVPNGAKNTDFINESIHLFDSKKIIIAVDNDTNGIELRDELIRRFGAENCKTVSFKECKDANEYLIKYGAFELQEVVKKAVDVPIDGNISVNSFRTDLEDMFINGIPKGKTINETEIDRFCTWETKRLAVVTGRPGSGKSEFVDYLICKLNILYGWKAAYFTPENFPLKYHYAKMYEKFIGKEFNSTKSEQIDFDIAYEHIQDNFFYILPESDLTVDKILNNAKSYIKSKGIKILVIDPFNKLDHQVAKNQTETQYISVLLDKLTMFAKVNDILIFLVAHPRKLDKTDVPTLYDISGSSHFYNKTDYGFTVHRVFDNNNLMTNHIEIHFQKIKFKNLGEQGVSELVYNYVNGRFEQRKSIEQWDNSNWLVKTQTEYSENFSWESVRQQTDTPF
jgi:twinkle protein